MARKQDYIQSKATGEPLAPVESELDELEQAHVQEEILNPVTVELTLSNGEVLYLPTELSLKDIFRTKILNSLRYFYLLMQSELKHVRSGEIDSDDPLVVGILFKPSIQNAMEEMLVAVLKKPLSHFEGQLDENGTLQVFTWVMKTLTANQSKGKVEQDPKK